jgi:benzylsuccinate CoA-transferase BbsF subunit
MMSSAPLANLRVLDLSWVMVGPMSGRYLADLGAEVIKVESSSRLDPLRTLGPFIDGVSHPERTLSYHFINAGKRSLALNLGSDAGRRIVLRLVREMDVVIESFTAGTLDRMGLGWDQLHAENPRLIMAASCLFGQTGPERAASGVGTLGAAYSGASHLVGWPDRSPNGPFNAWTDSVTPRFLVTAVLAALRRRNRTGAGCYIDVSQAEAGLQFLLPAYFQYAANGQIPARCGHDPDPLRAPSGVFPCAGDDAWVAIDASADVHWQALRQLLSPALDSSVFNNLVGRLRQRAQLHEALAQCTRGQNAEQLELDLQAQGIPAHVVCDHAALAGDADLIADGYYGQISDAQIGTVRMRNAQCAILPAAQLAALAAPRIGDSSDDILCDIGGYSADEISRFRQDGVLA